MVRSIRTMCIVTDRGDVSVRVMCVTPRNGWSTISAPFESGQKPQNRSSVTVIAWCVREKLCNGKALQKSVRLPHAAAQSWILQTDVSTLGSQNSCARDGAGCTRIRIRDANAFQLIYEENEAPHDWRRLHRCRCSASGWAPLLRGRVRCKQARDAQGQRDENRVGESTHLGVSGCDRRSRQRPAVAVRRWSSQYADTERLDQGFLEAGRSGQHRWRVGEGRLEDLQRARRQAAGWPERSCRFLRWRHSASGQALGAYPANLTPRWNAKAAKAAKKFCLILRPLRPL